MVFSASKPSQSKKGSLAKDKTQNVTIGLLERHLSTDKKASKDHEGMAFSEMK